MKDRPMTNTDRTDDTLKSLLADYVAPTQDAGFSKAFMARLDHNTIDLEDYAARPSPLWRSWLVAIILGLICGLLWVRFGVSLPEIEWRDGTMHALHNDWVIYLLCGLGASFCLMLVETDAI